VSQTRILAFGDNHGDTGALATILDEIGSQLFDYIVHTGDITNAWKTDLKTGVEQLKEVEQRFERFAELGSLIYTYGNRDAHREQMGERSHVTDEYELSVGHRVSSDSAVTVDGQRFCGHPDDLAADDILLTHHFRTIPFYQETGRAYLSGDTHFARRRGTSLNTGYLHNHKGFDGGYFTIGLEDDAIDVTVHGVNESWKEFVCDDHPWYGTQYTPAKFGCGLCKFGPQKQLARLLKTAIYAEIPTDQDSLNPVDCQYSVDELVATIRD
jgi:hypothetical protein